MNIKNTIPLTPFQKDIIRQVLHDELENNLDANIVQATEFTDDIVHKIEKSMIMAVGLKQARAVDFWGKIEEAKSRIKLSIKQV